MIYKMWWKLSTPGSPESILPVTLSISSSPVSPYSPVTQSVPIVSVFPYTRWRSVLCQAEWQWWWEMDISATTLPVTKICFVDILGIGCLPSCHLYSYLNYPCYHSRQANFECGKCYQMYYPDYFRLHDGWLSLFRGHLILGFLLQGGLLLTKLVGKVITPTI